MRSFRKQESIEDAYFVNQEDERVWCVLFGAVCPVELLSFNFFCRSIIVKRNAEDFNIKVSVGSFRV